MKPKLHRYEAPDWGVGELWLAGDRVLWSELPRPAASGAAPGPRHPVADRLIDFFAGAPDDLADIELDLGFEREDGFYAACAAALRAVPRGEVVTYGELAALAGRPGAARAAGTFCARNRHGPFIPCHRVVGASGLGSYGSLGLDYKARLLALEHVVR